MKMTNLMFLNDQRTFTNLKGCQVVSVPADWDTEQILDALREGDDAVTVLHTFDAEEEIASGWPLYSEQQYYQQIADENAIMWSIWSIGGTMFSDHHGFPGARFLRHQMPEDKAPIDEPINGPRWLDLWRAIDMAIAGRNRKRDCCGLAIESELFITFRLVRRRVP